MKLSTLSLSLGLLAAASFSTAHAQSADQQVDYSGFADLVGEVESYRADRLIDLDGFLSMASDPAVMILDTRSAAAFAQGHLEGAVNLPFSAFTEDSLAAVIGDKAQTILIYCNNNFSDDLAPVPLKRAPLALNIPTFINLYGYGYRDVYELDETIAMDDARVNFVRD